MIQWLIKHLKDIGLITLVIGGLLTLTAVVNLLIPWTWLTYFFAFMRRTVLIFDFMSDTDTLWIVFGRSLQIVIAIWTVKIIFIITKWFKK